MAKLLTVAANGQISIGKEWAGKQILVEVISAHELRIVSGSFVPDRELPYHTQEAKQTLDAFDEWSEKTPPKRTDRKTLIARLEKKSREKKQN